MTEHPEDRHARLEGERLATDKKAKKFIEHNMLRMAQLLRTYGDEDAGSLLIEMREIFWTEHVR